MPFIHVELVEGRSQEQLTNMMKEITEAVHKNIGNNSLAFLSREWFN